MTTATAVRHQRPFPGMRPFEREEADLFFGQEKQIAELVRRLGRSRLLGIVGESGCGKSSLVKAGLIPTLLGGHSPETSLWRISVSQPGTAPIHQLAESLAVSIAATLSVDEIDARLRASSYGLLDLIQRANLPAGRRVLIVIDQFEELFRLWRESEDSTASRDEAALFVKLLLAVTERPMQTTAVPTYVALTMRSEYLGDCALFFGLAEAINDGAYLLPKMSRSNVEAAIVRPLEAFDATIDNDLLQELLNETEIAQQDGLPLLQHGLKQLWTRAAKRPAPIRLTMADLRAVDEATPGVLFLEKHFNAHLDGRLKSLKDAQQKTIATLFKQLGEYDAKGRLIRRTCMLRQALDVCQVSEADLLKAADAFRDDAGGQSFLMPPRDRTEELKQGHEPLGVSHEALLRHWATLVAWIDEEARDAEAFKMVAARAVAVDDPDPLRGVELMRAVELRKRVSESWSRRYQGVYDKHVGRYQFDYGRTIVYIDGSQRRSGRRRAASLATVLLGIFAAGWITFSEIARREARKDDQRQKENAAELAAANQRLTATNNELETKRAELETKTREQEKTQQSLRDAVADLTKSQSQLAAQIKETQTALGETIRAQSAAEEARRRAERSAEDANAQRVIAEAATAELTGALDRLEMASNQRDRDQRLRLLAARDMSFDPATALTDLEGLAALARSYAVDYKELPSDVLTALQRAVDLTFLHASDESSNDPVLVAMPNPAQARELMVVRRGAPPAPLGVKVPRENWSVQKAELVPGNPELAIGGAGGFTAVTKLDVPGNVTHKLHPFAVTGLGFSTDGEWMATASAGGDMRVIRHDDLHHLSVFKDRIFQFGNAAKLVTFLMLHRFKGDYAVKQFALRTAPGPDGKTTRRDVSVVALTEAGRVVLWQRPGPFGKQLSGLDHVSVPGTFTAVATNPVTQDVWIAGSTSSSGNAIGVFEMTSQFAPCPGLNGGMAVSALAWNDGGDRLALGFRDGTVRVIATKAPGRCSSTSSFVTLPAHTTAVTSLSWHGDLLATGANDGSARLWTMPSDSDRMLIDRLSDLEKSRTPNGAVALGSADIDWLFQAVDRRLASAR